MSDDVSGSLQPPSRRMSMSIEDPGARDLESSDSDDHFSDAQSGRGSTGNSRPTSPIPITRVERVDHEPSYGEKPGTPAYDKRTEDAIPDEIAFVEENQDETPFSPLDRPLTPGGRPIPITVVEKIDPSVPSHGEVPGTHSYQVREQDAVPDVVLRSPVSGRSTPDFGSRSRSNSTPGDLPIPITKVERVDSTPSYGEVPGTLAYEMRKGDAEPDIVEERGDVPGKTRRSHTSLNERLTRPGSPTSSHRSSSISETREISSVKGILVANDMNDYDEAEDGDDGGFGDDFDDFEEGDEDTEFGDFDDGFQEPETVQVTAVQSLPKISPSFPVLNFDNLESPGEVMATTEPYLDQLFPPDTIDTSTVPAASNENPVFLTQRSASLWSQLVAPPPLQPPNWIRSRIRRLFLVSLGVPVDLDEILPASKQKKLILPSTNLYPSSSSPRNSTDSRAGGSIARLKATDGNTSSTSVDSQGKSSTSRRRKGPRPAPELDLVYARQLCTMTDEALAGLTIEELKEHVNKLEAMQSTAKEVLEYWTKRTDEKLGDREAFEGVIENLVKHARKVRK